MNINCWSPEIPELSNSGFFTLRTCHKQKLRVIWGKIKWTQSTPRTNAIRSKRKQINWVVNKENVLMCEKLFLAWKDKKSGPAFSEHLKLAFQSFQECTFQSLFAKSEREDPLVWLQFKFGGIWVYQVAWTWQNFQGRDDDKDQVTEFNQKTIHWSEQIDLISVGAGSVFLEDYRFRKWFFVLIVFRPRFAHISSTPSARIDFHSWIFRFWIDDTDKLIQKDNFVSCRIAEFEWCDS